MLSLSESQARSPCLSAAVIAVSVWSAMAELPTPKVPARPAPYFSWATVPVAFHGANKARLYTQQEVEQLANRYQMITLEKWYTPCGAQGPNQAGPECHVEQKMASTFKAIKAANPNVTTMLYLNSMFNFAAYSLNGLMLDREAQGFDQPAEGQARAVSLALQRRQRLLQYHHIRFECKGGPRSVAGDCRQHDP